MNYHLKCIGADDKTKILKENRFCCIPCEKNRKATPPTPTRIIVPRKTRAFAQARSKPISTDNKFSSDGKAGFLGFNANEAIPSSTDDETNEIDAKRRRTRSMEQPTQKQPTQKQPTQKQPTQKQPTQKQPTQIQQSSPNDGETSIPDASRWTADDVFKYFEKKFPKYAHVFKEQEIDGASLYLLKRGDVIKGFNLKVGPALKLYGHILKLQTKSNDPTLCWQ